MSSAFSRFDGDAELRGPQRKLHSFNMLESSMTFDNLIVTFETKVRKKSKGFKLPEKLAKLFGFKSKGSLGLVITRPSSGETLYSGDGKYTSWCEVTTPNVCGNLKKGEKIRVSVSNPSSSHKKSNPSGSLAKSPIKPARRKSSRPLPNLKSTPGVSSGSGHKDESRLPLPTAVKETAASAPLGQGNVNKKRFTIPAGKVD